MAKKNGEVVGLAWSRCMRGHDYVNDQTPEIAVAVLENFRGHGIASMMLKTIHQALHRKGYPHTSLSVSKGNPAVSLYEHLGYEILREEASDYVMFR